MSTTTVKKSEKQGAAQSSNKEIATFIGELFAFNSSLKLYHWSVTGTGSYAKHMALDEAIDSLLGVIDRITETTYALVGELHISIPETKTPGDITKHASDFYHYVEKHRDLFPEAFSQSIIDDYQEAIQQLIYRLVRLQ
jgi:DNA-binding ferritin-like protein